MRGSIIVSVSVVLGQLIGWSEGVGLTSGRSRYVGNIAGVQAIGRCGYVDEMGCRTD